MADYTNALKGVTQEALADTGRRGAGPYDLAHLDIGEDGDVEVFTLTYYGGDGTPESVWHSRTLRHTLSGNADLDELRELLAEGGKASALIDRVVAGHSVEWSGSNHVGRLTADAKEAEEALVALLEDLPTSDLTAWDTEEWCRSTYTARAFLADRGLTTDATDEQIEAAAESLRASAGMDGVVLTGNKAVEDVIREAIEEVRGQDAEEEEDA